MLWLEDIPHQLLFSRRRFKQARRTLSQCGGARSGERMSAQASRLGSETVVLDALDKRIVNRCSEGGFPSANRLIRGRAELDTPRRCDGTHRRAARCRRTERFGPCIMPKFGAD